MDARLDPSTIPAFPSQATQDNARSFSRTALALHGVALVVFVGRMWSRCFPVFRLHKDDYVCIVAYILVAVNSSMLLASIPYSFGYVPNDFSLADAQIALRYAVTAKPIWAWSMAAIKISFALMLVRIEQSINIRRFLWAMIAVQLALGAYNTFALLLRCVPLSKAWDLMGTVQGTCWSRRAQATSTIVSSVINILTDFALALLPISFLRKIQRPLRERIIVGMLMGLGVFAGVASCMKIVAATQLGRTVDPINERINIAMWSVVEELVGIIVICIPCLRSPFQRALEYCGLLSVSIRTHPQARGYDRTYDPSEEIQRTIRSRSQIQDHGCLAIAPDTDHGAGFALDNIHSRGVEPHTVYEHPRGVGEIWCTKEVMVENETICSRMPSYERPRCESAGGWANEPFDLAQLHIERGT
ncbi:hypothetical protein BKA66DRAFT_614405 [Pyrenochaeta sp. MPI-SDFR-AT-0127]|nr:hypothetical protein BKA66DRAFT_614405 [Pyrenochaeta sp. MPI-SDFR-AT-0127]